MHGSWTLVRMGGKAAHEGKPNWLLIKEHDEFERATGAPCITEEAQLSAVTGRSLEQIAAESTHVWNSKEHVSDGQNPVHRQDHSSDTVPPATAGKTKSAPPARTKSATSKPDAAAPASDDPNAALLARVQVLPKEPLPAFLKPQLADEATTPPSGAEWVHELKFDGYRVQAHKRGRSVTLYTRSGLDWTHRMKPIATALASIPADNCVVDGEVVVLDTEGLSSFARLQASFEKNEKHPLTFFAFDLLHIDGHNTRGLPLRDRKLLLREALGEDTDELRLSEDLQGDGPNIFAAACKLHAEGIISKRADEPYRSGRSLHWLKSKCLFQQEFVIGGFTDLSNGSRGIGSLLVGYYDDHGKLTYAGRAGTGFTQKLHTALRDRLEPMVQKTCPFKSMAAEARRGAHWVKPELVTQVRFATWTAEQQLRQASFQGLRDDKPAQEVRRETGPPSAKVQRETLEAIPTPAGKPERKPVRSRAVKAAPSKPAAPLPALRLTHPSKVIDQASGLTKRQLMEYLWAVSAEMLPHVADRPLSLVRCPDGSEKPCFYQKHINQLLPKGIDAIMVSDKKGGTPEPYISLNTAEALASLAQVSVLEVHPWGSTRAHLEQPDRIVIDLDPDEALPWSAVVEGAFEVRTLLTSLKLQSFIKTTGGKGLHVVFPLVPEHDFATMKAWAHGLVQSLERVRPARYLSTMTKAARTGKIYLDYLRNERGATAVAPYSMRARKGAPVSVPLSWTALEASTERPDCRIANYSEWSGEYPGSAWSKLLTVEQRLTKEALERFTGRQARRAAAV